MVIMVRLLERNALYHQNAKIYDAVRQGLWQRELERRRLLAEAK